jgi:hypothetical protein
MINQRLREQLNLVKARIGNASALAQALRMEIPGSNTDENKILGLIGDLKDLIQVIRINTRASKLKDALQIAGITPSELYILTFSGITDLFQKARKGDKKAQIELTRTIEESAKLWQSRIFSPLLQIQNTNYEETKILKSIVKEFSMENKRPSSEIVVLLGAGASKPLDLPTMADFGPILRNLAENWSDDRRDALNKVFEVYKIEFGDDLPDLEKILFLVDKYNIYYTIMFDDPVFGKNEFDLLYFPSTQKPSKNKDIAKLQMDTWYHRGMSGLGDYLNQLLFSLYWPKVDKVKVTSLYSPFFELLQRDFGQKVITIYTTNYDPTIESYCEYNEVMMENGFFQAGAKEKWNPAKYSSFQPIEGKLNLMLYKLHGSLSWKREDDEIINYGIALRNGPGETALIYPTETKEYPYEEPFKTAYRHLEDDLTACKTLIAIGYSFRDKGISNILRDTKGKNPGMRIITIAGKSAESEHDPTGRLPPGSIILPVNFEYGKDPMYLTLLREKLNY